MIMAVVMYSDLDIYILKTVRPQISIAPVSVSFHVCSQESGSEQVLCFHGLQPIGFFIVCHSVSVDGDNFYP